MKYVLLFSIALVMSPIVAVGFVYQLSARSFRVGVKVCDDFIDWF